jgi:hypothetical protein
VAVRLLVGVAVGVAVGDGAAMSISIKLPGYAVLPPSGRSCSTRLPRGPRSAAEGVAVVDEVRHTATGDVGDGHKPAFGI